MIPRPEYPRPQLVRGDESWINLNGKWFFEIDNAESGGQRGLYKMDRYEKEIIVPFVPESEASGIENVDFMTRVWYCRTFTLPESFDSTKGKILLHFGAMNYEGQVWINDAFMGEHKGGYVPATFDITTAVQAGENRINVTCKNEVRNPLQPSGKQCSSYANHGCFYTRCTGIWQTVWIEYVPNIYIDSIKMLPDVKGEKLDVTVYLAGGNADITAKVFYKGEFVSEAKALSHCNTATFSVNVPDPHLWNVGAPELYDIEITAGEDKITSYFGMRSVDIVGNKFMLNDKSVFMRLVLDQGYYEKGIYTALSDDEFVRDIKLSMEAGFNGARMHMKVFEPRFIYHADKMGYLLWDEFPNWGLDIARPEAMNSMIPEWLQILRRDVNSPAVIGWCAFNESWPGGSPTLYNTTYDITKMFDPTRPVIDTSGWIHLGKTDIFDVHDYVQPKDEFKAHYVGLVDGSDVFYNGEGGGPSAPYDRKMPFFVSEFGGSFWDIDTKEESHGQESGNPWGYGDAPKTKEELQQRMIDLCTILLDNPGVCGFCYTQFTDVMQEMNGVFSFDRRSKVDLEKVHAALSRKAAIED